MSTKPMLLFLDHGRGHHSGLDLKLKTDIIFFSGAIALTNESSTEEFQSIVTAQVAIKFQFCF